MSAVDCVDARFQPPDCLLEPREVIAIRLQTLLMDTCGQYVDKIN